MMKLNTILLFAVLLSVSCNSEKESKETIAKPKATQQIVGIGKIAPEHDIILLTSSVGGVVQSINQKENQEVQEGTLLLELNHDLEDQTVKQQQRILATQSQQIKSDLASVKEYQIQYRFAESELHHLEVLAAQGAETQQVVSNQSEKVEVLRTNVEQSKAKVLVSKNKLLECQQELKTAQVTRDQKRILSPVDGTLLELSVLVGGSISLGEVFAQIRTKGATIALCEIDESMASKIRVGQIGFIRLVGSTDTLARGTVYFVSSFLNNKSLFTNQSGEREDRRVLRLKMKLDDAENLFLNTRVECVIDVSNPLNK